jgi:hypothetical protein
VKPLREEWPAQGIALILKKRGAARECYFLIAKIILTAKFHYYCEEIKIENRK